MIVRQFLVSARTGVQLLRGGAGSERSLGLHGQEVTRLARETALNRENMYRILSEEGNPRLSSLKALLDSLDLRLAIEPKRAVA